MIKLHREGPAAYKIDTLVLAVIGDLITGYIHEDLRQSNFLSPTRASLFARDLLRNGIDYLLKYSGIKNIIIPCMHGNHSRTTDKPLVNQAAENSYEWLLFKVLEDHYINNDRVKFYVAESAFLYQEVFGMTIRWHHGDFLKFQGGVGGLSVPLRKAIDAWNIERFAHLTVIGHYHQMLDGNDYLCNGSLIGYNEYSRKIKARWEPPRQTFFLVDKLRGKRCVSPIYVDKNYMWDYSQGS